MSALGQKRTSGTASVLVRFVPRTDIVTLPAFLGLIIVVPVLGHATWHLYRKVVP